MSAALQKIVLSVINRFNLNLPVLSALISQRDNHARQQKKNDIVSAYIKSSEANFSNSNLIEILTARQQAGGAQFPKLLAVSNDYVGSRIMVDGYFEKELLLFLKNNLFNQPGIAQGIALDIGAFIGTHAVLMAGFFKYVISFEPNPSIYHVLLANIIESGQKNILTANYGLASDDDSLPYYKYTGGNLGMNKFGDKNDTAAQNDANLIKVGDVVVKNAGRAIEAIIQENNLGDTPITLIKIDTEGFELKVLTGLMPILQKHNAVVLFESIGAQQTTTLVNFLKQAGYRSFTSLNEYEPISPTPLVIEEKFYPLILASKEEKPVLG